MLIRHDEKIWKNWSSYQISDLIHDYVTRYADRNARLIDYGTGELHTSMEVHVLEKIFLHPGITVTELAETTNRTKGAVSQIVKRLCEKDLVKKTSQGKNERKQSLWVTERGKHLTELHIKYDDTRTAQFFAKVSEYYSDEEIDTFFKIMETCFQLLNPKSNYPWL